MSKNNIIRVQKNKANPYVMINKQCINDNRLTWAAKGLHTYLLSLPDDWTIYVNELVKHTSAGRDHTYTVIRELISCGYMQRFEYRYKGKVVESSYVVYENPVEVGQLTKSMATIVKVDIDNEGNYIPIVETIENSTVQPFTESTDSVTTDTVDTTLLNNNNNKIINKINNDIVVVASEKETQLLEMYKSFKLEKNVMPHTLKLLKANCDKFDLEVFEQIFINASSDDVKKKYNYIKDTLDKLVSKGIFTIEQYNNDQEQRKAVRDSKKTYRQSNSNTSVPKVKTRFHNINERFSEYSPEELEKGLKESQKDKFKNKDIQEIDMDAIREQAIDLLQERINADDTLFFKPQVRLKLDDFENEINDICNELLNK